MTYAEDVNQREYERVDAVIAESDFATFVENLRTAGSDTQHSTWAEVAPKEPQLDPRIAGSAIGAVVFAGFVFAIVMFGSHGVMRPIAHIMGLG